VSSFRRSASTLTGPPPTAVRTGVRRAMDIARLHQVEMEKRFLDAAATHCDCHKRCAASPGRMPRTIHGCERTPRAGRRPCR
jgi:hypothetical protein